MTKTIKWSAALAIVAAAGLLAVNKQPILSGAGSLLFPEASPAASIAASAGALTISAGGSNKNIILTPSGTGVVSAGGGLLIANSASFQTLDSGGTARALVFMDGSNVVHLRNNQGGVGGTILIEPRAGGAASLSLDNTGLTTLTGNLVITGGTLACTTATTSGLCTNATCTTTASVTYVIHCP